MSSHGQKKGGNVINDGVGIGLIKIPKRLEKEREEIIEELRNYK
jgi:hypothetical protein